MLFKPNQDVPTFVINELFKEDSVSKTILKIDLPSSLSLKPSDLYNRIRDIATKRYGYELPLSQTELKCLQHPNNKIALLRDLCIKLGIKILSHQHKDYILDNDIN